MNDDKNDLTVEEIKEKIDRVNQDILLLQSEADATRRFEVLTEYLSYLKDELKTKERGQKT